MIKKFNIALAIAFAVLIAFKAVKALMPERGGSAAVAAKAAAAAEVESLAINVYYDNWTYFAQEDRISNRNGICLDTLRAIFPKARFHRVNVEDVSSFAEKLREDPSGVLCTFGNHPDLKDFPAAPTPIGQSKIVLYTLRSNPWRYTGPESLEKVKIAAARDFLDFKVLRDLYERFGEDSPRLKVLPANTAAAEFEKIVETGEADAFVATGVKLNNALSADAAQQRSSTSRLKRFRFSAEIARDDVLLRVSSADPDISKRIVDAYEKGIRRIDANGQRRRIFEYYGFVPQPLPPPQVQ